MATFPVPSLPLSSLLFSLFPPSPLCLSPPLSLSLPRPTPYPSLSLSLPPPPPFFHLFPHHQIQLFSYLCSVVRLPFCAIFSIKMSYKRVVILSRGVIIIIIAFKGAIRDFLQSPHSAANCLQHARSSGPGVIVCKSRATHRALITCNMSCYVPLGTKGQLSYLV